MNRAELKEKAEEFFAQNIRPFAGCSISDLLTDFVLWLKKGEPVEVEPVGDIHCNVDDSGRKHKFANLYDECPDEGYLYTSPPPDHRDERIKELDLALDAWREKTEWVQESCRPKELGMHRADVLKNRISELTSALKVVKDAIDRYGHSKYCSRGMAFAVNKNTKAECTCYMHEALTKIEELGI